MADQFLNQVHLARRWHMSPRTLERWRWTGEGPAYLKIGGRVVYRLEDVETFERERRCESTAQGNALRAAR
jgi:hypothetical protein